MEFWNVAMFPKKHDFSSFWRSSWEPKCIQLSSKNDKKPTSENTSFSESLLQWFRCILGCLFPPIFAVFRIPKANERKSAYPYQTLPLCSEIKGWSFEKRSKITQKLQKVKEKTIAKTDRGKSAFWEVFGLPFGRLLGDFSIQKRSAKTTRKKEAQKTTGNQRTLNPFGAQNYVPLNPIISSSIYNIYNIY